MGFVLVRFQLVQFRVYVVQITWCRAMYKIEKSKEKAVKETNLEDFEKKTFQSFSQSSSHTL